MTYISELKRILGEHLDWHKARIENWLVFCLHATLILKKFYVK